MVWKPFRFVAGDLVEVLSKEEILSTLDQHGFVDGMPFMPEMLQFCGKQFRVRAVAHKTCDTVHRTGSRRLRSTVHLADLRCDGSAHGGCQAECSLFWKHVWLKPVSGTLGDGERVKPKSYFSACTEPQLYTNSRLSDGSNGGESRYACQATRLYKATEPLSLWNPRQYLLDVTSGNRSYRRVLRVAFLGALRWLVPRVPFAYRFFKLFTDYMHERLLGRKAPSLCGKINRGEPTPTGRLDLKSGEYVRIRSQEEIEQTLDRNGKNRGLGFDSEEMAPYCGQLARVRSRVTKIIDETTGIMREMKQPCIVLEGVMCSGDYASHKLLCPRAIHAYWREIWLDRITNVNSERQRNPEIAVEQNR
jgi:hypothetical protein